MRIYLDTCCYNRQFDDQSQQRVYDEFSAITSIIQRNKNGEGIILGSDVLRMEIENISAPIKKFQVLSNYFQTIDEVIHFNDAILQNAVEIANKSNIQRMDALHLSFAEYGKADAFITTDDKLIKACKKLNFSVEVFNPIIYLAEVFRNA